MITDDEKLYYTRSIVAKLASVLIKKDLEKEDLEVKDFLHCCNLLTLKEEHKDEIPLLAAEIFLEFKNNSRFKTDVYIAALDTLKFVYDVNNPEEFGKAQIKMNELSILGRLYVNLLKIKDKIK